LDGKEEIMDLKSMENEALEAAEDSITMKRIPMFTQDSIIHAVNLTIVAFKIKILLVNCLSCI